MNKRVWSILLTLCMIFALLPATAAAANVLISGKCGANATWVITDDGVMTISGTGAVTEGPRWDVAGDYVTQLESIVVEEGITSIGDAVLCASPDLVFSEKALYLPDSLQTIGDAAFASHENLKEIHFGSKLTSIGENAFMYCFALEEIALPTSLKSIGSFAFCDTALREITVPGSIKILQQAVFAGCTKLTTVTLENGVEEIGANEFSGCSSLKDIRYPKTLKRILPNAFANCTSLESMDLSTFSVIPDFCFSGCTNLEIVYLDRASSIGKNAFENCRKLQDIYLPDTITTIDESAFSGCSALEEVRLPAKLRTIPYGLFMDCTALQDIIMPNTVTQIEKSAFSGCSSLQAIYYAGTEQQLEKIQIESYGNTILQDVAVYLIPSMPDPVFGLFDMPAQDNWAYDGIAFCLYSGLMNGMGGGYFQPNGTTTRAQLVTILWRMMDEPKPTKAAPFTDLTQDWYRDAVAWAAENGITTGTSAKTFSPDTPVTREQMVTIFYRMCKDYLKLDVSPAAALSAFPDNSSVSSWAKNALQWGVAVKLINGVADGKGSVFLQPQGNATRAQIATVMRNFVNAFHTD